MKSSVILTLHLDIIVRLDENGKNDEGNTEGIEESSIRMAVGRNCFCFAEQFLFRYFKQRPERKNIHLQTAIICVNI